MNKNHHLHDLSKQPWYRFSEVWLMIGLPIVVVAASMVTIVIAYQHAPIITPKTLPLPTVTEPKLQSTDHNR